MLKMTSIVSENILGNTEPHDDLIKHEIYHRLTIGFKGRHYLFPLRKVVTNENDIIVTSRHWVPCHEINTPLGEGPYHDDGNKSRASLHFSGVKFAQMTAFHCFHTIFEDCGQ